MVVVVVVVVVPPVDETILPAQFGGSCSWRSNGKIDRELQVTGRGGQHVLLKKKVTQQWSIGRLCADARAAAQRQRDAAPHRCAKKRAVER